jgi:hypothetical protein
VHKHQTKPNQTKPNQTKPNQTKPNQTKPNQTKPNQTKPNQILPIDDVFSRVNSDSNLSEDINEYSTHITKTPIHINYAIKRLESIIEP